MRIVLKPGAMKAIRNSGAVISALQGRANAIASAAGDGMEVMPPETGNRARVAVVTATYEARLAEAHDSRLSSAMDAGR